MRTLMTYVFACFAVAAAAVGCKPAAESDANTTLTSEKSSAADDHADGVAHDHEGHDHASHEGADVAHDEHAHSSHDGWWCNEHGVPEGVCALCSSKVAADFQRNGDWCEDHDRPDSQCFVCHPELEARFAAQYEAKYGEKPPKPAS
jgi:hypothetical protein